ncbi:hypothetical protein RJ640_012833 [Escallonia rubra]|uniref:SHSP domain-containing protein n=1 Tax=Escallonia rubra TaxID=112253 RepID=A0AA88SN54_9ASTE|nr:hypothetical protein RJ640_012833 [Escallonia rubra]
MALLMAVKRATSSTLLTRFNNRTPNHYPAMVVPFPARSFSATDSSEDNCTITANGGSFTRSDEFPIYRGVSDQYLENPFQVSGPKGAYEAKKVEEGLFVRMEMPGIEKDDVQISVEYNNVKIKGEGKKESKHEDSGRSYSGGIELCSNVFQPQKIEAEMKNGVLRMIIPRAKTSDYKDSSRSLEIRVK